MSYLFINKGLLYYEYPFYTKHKTQVRSDPAYSYSGFIVVSCL